MRHSARLASDVGHDGGRIAHRCLLLCKSHGFQLQFRPPTEQTRTRTPPSPLLKCFFASIAIRPKGGGDKKVLTLALDPVGIQFLTVENTAVLFEPNGDGCTKALFRLSDTAGKTVAPGDPRFAPRCGQ